MRRTAAIVVLILATGGAVTGCSSSGTEPKAPVTVTVPHTVVAPPPASSIVADPVEETAVDSPTIAVTTAPATNSFDMPNEVGKGLQAAQDDIQRVSGNPLFFTNSKDATGANRLQILDRNWKVCSQNIGVGQKFTEDSDITFSVVKLEESCP